MFFAVETGQDAALIEILLQAGADANKSNFTGETPLHLAARRGYVSVVDKLLVRL